MQNRTLVLAPHTDDGEFGFWGCKFNFTGGTLMEGRSYVICFIFLDANYKINYLFASLGSQNLRRT